jgi:putative nucleotidyltransferase with HDIG domain
MVPKIDGFPEKKLIQSTLPYLKDTPTTVITQPEDKLGLSNLQTNSLIASKINLRDTFSLMIIMATDEKNLSDTISIFSLLNDSILYTYKNLAFSEELHRSYLDTIALLSHLIEMKDAYTSTHTQRTTHYARAICQKLNLPESITRYIEQAALLHDIGKVAIDSNILLKPSSLTPDERKEIQKHPLLGANILNPILYLKPLSSIILYHHEWYNGAGYPEGLKGNEIPLGARIIAVLDAFDAMLSDRPYRKALSLEQTIEELKKAKGTQFDPKIVDVFIEVLMETNPKQWWSFAKDNIPNP